MIPISSPKCVSFQKMYPFIFFDTIFIAVLSLCSVCFTSLLRGSCGFFPEWYPTLRRFYFMIPLISPDFSILWQWCWILRRFSRFNPYFPLIPKLFSSPLFHLFPQNDTTFIAKPAISPACRFIQPILMPFYSPIAIQKNFKKFIPSQNPYIYRIFRTWYQIIRHVRWDRKSVV